MPYGTILIPALRRRHEEEEWEEFENNGGRYQSIVVLGNTKDDHKITIFMVALMLIAAVWFCWIYVDYQQAIATPHSLYHDPFFQQVGSLLIAGGILLRWLLKK